MSEQKKAPEIEISEAELEKQRTEERAVRGLTHDAMVARKRRKKEFDRRSRLTPVSERPLVCPPGAGERGIWYTLIGLALRALVIFLAVFGMTYFIADALGFVIPAEGATEPLVLAGTLAKYALLFVAILFICSYMHPALGIPLAIALSVGALLYVNIIGGSGSIVNNVVSVINQFLDHMIERGYLGLTNNKVMGGYISHYGFDGGFAVITFITAWAIVPFAARRIRIAIPALFSTAVMVAVFMYNLTGSNWGVAMVIASYSALCVMYAFDRLYARGRRDDIDDDKTLFEPKDRPKLPEWYRTRGMKKAERRSERKERKGKRRQEADRRLAVDSGSVKLTLDEELSDYFSSEDTPREKKKKEKMAKRTERLSRDERRARRRELSKYKKYERRRATRNSASGGMAGALVCLLAMLMLVVPATTATGAFSTIDAIDGRMDYYREYVTAMLMGRDPLLDDLAFDAEAELLNERSTEATPRYFSGIPMMTVEANTSNNIYLRGWIATDYIDGSWYSPTRYDETMKRYRELYSTLDDPAETIKYDFLRTFLPELNVLEGIADGAISKKSYGFIMEQVSMKRTPDLVTKQALLPSFHVKAADHTTTVAGGYYPTLSKYGSLAASELTYANYFDGIYSGYKLSTDTEGYSSVALVTTMKDKDFYLRTSEMIAQFNELMYALQTNKLPRSQTQGVSGTTGENKTTVYLNDDKSVFATVTSERSIASPAASITRVDIPGPDGTTYRYYANAAGDIYSKQQIGTDGYVEAYNAPDLTLLQEYVTLMSYSEKAELSDLFARTATYSNFVYDTYTGKGDSQIVRDTLAGILADEDNLGIDAKTAAKKNNYTADRQGRLVLVNQNDSDVYIERHKLVMAIADHLNENYAYSLTPEQPENNELDGVDTFLSLTKEGYCVQFASAAVLMLREAGIPARYVDGYIVSGLSRTHADDRVALYKGTVRDWDAHSWIEVWYDGIGWVQYEMTPKYYGEMYSTTRPIVPTVPDDTDDPEDPGDTEDPDDMLPPVIGPEDPEDPTGNEVAEARRRLIIMIVVIVLSVLATAALIWLAVWLVLRRAKKYAAERQALFDRIKSGEASEDELIRFLDLQSDLLGRCKSLPEAGEFRADYAARIAEEYALAFRREEKAGAPTLDDGLKPEDIGRLLDAVSAFEFGRHLPDPKTAAELVELYEILYRGAYKRRVNPFVRFWLYCVTCKM